MKRVDGTTAIPKPESEWILVYDHHPAIVTIDEYNLVQEIRKDNLRLVNRVGQSHHGQRVYVFSGLLYCDICGSRMSVNSGRKHTDGYVTEMYHCPLRRQTKRCSNKSVNDLIIGEFVINYVLNILNAHKSFRKLKSVADLQNRLLSGSTFSSVNYIDHDGLSDLWRIFEQYKDSDVFTVRPKKRKRKIGTAAQKELDRQRRALERLNHLYLYSDTEMSEPEYLSRKEQITARIQELQEKTPDAKQDLPDDEFIRLASHLLISEQLKCKKYIYYKELIQTVSPDVMRQYMLSIIDSITVAYSRVASITFKNGMIHRFVYGGNGVNL